MIYTSHSFIVPFLSTMVPKILIFILISAPEFPDHGEEMEKLIMILKLRIAGSILHDHYFKDRPTRHKSRCNNRVYPPGTCLVNEIVI